MTRLESDKLIQGAANESNGIEKMKRSSNIKRSVIVSFNLPNAIL